MAKAGTERRALIERMALRLFAERGYAAVTTKDIAKACGVGESALYRHMDSKEELAVRVFRTAYLGLAGRLLGAAPEEAAIGAKIGAYLQVLLDTFDRDPDLVLFLLGRQHDILARAIGPEDMTPLLVVRAALVRAQAQGEIRQGDPDLLTAMTLGAAFQPLTFAQFGRLPAPAIQHAGPIRAGILRLLGTAGAEDAQ
ncbi:TetR/AcrR family transcriptional regulator [Mangrovicoccus ximenensis]|uniref:TetR/AcrR family transcriptional regulator n=1 Tax=Mangrovicoccus ximenensis TaxID=1911570 RepID=UPI0013752394|nr:TetR/AcrR family transcriptional regulator [Mangrovicoccus ximenensis]